MTTSGTTALTTTAGDLIADAMGLLGVLAAGETISGDDYALGLRFLNLTVKQMAARPGRWLAADVTHTVTPGTSSYTVGSGMNIDTERPQGLLAARRRDSAGTELEVEVVSRDEYMNLSNKTLQAPVQMAYYDPQRANGVLYVWPTGSSGNTTIVLTFQRPVEIFTSVADDVDLPEEYALMMTYRLAVMLGPSYAGTPQAVASESERLWLLWELADCESASVKVRPR